MATNAENTVDGHIREVMAISLGKRVFGEESWEQKCIEIIRM